MMTRARVTSISVNPDLELIPLACVGSVVLGCIVGISLYRPRTEVAQRLIVATICYVWPARHNYASCFHLTSGNDCIIATVRLRSRLAKGGNHNVFGSPVDVTIWSLPGWRGCCVQRFSCQEANSKPEGPKMSPSWSSSARCNAWARRYECSTLPFSATTVPKHTPMHHVSLP